MAQDQVFEVPDTATVTLESLNDLLITAIEQGTGYWAEIRNYRHENRDIVTVDIRENDQQSAENPGWHRISSLDLLNILPRLREIGQHKGMTIPEILENHDAETADCAVQFVIFGSITYG